MIPLLFACSAPNVAEDAFTRMAVDVVSEADQGRLAFTTLAAEAKETLRVAIPYVDDTELLQSFVDAAQRGVTVQVVVDIDLKNEPGVTVLQDGGVAVHLADGPVGYFDFGVNEDVVWDSTEVVMSHAFAVADHNRIVNASSIGRTGAFPRVVFQATSEDLAQDLVIEHNQVFGGSDASALTAYSAMAKSVADARWKYETGTDVVLEVWLGPQERLTKRIIDAAYGAKQSIWVMSDDFANGGLTRALQQKAETGFDVQVIVGSGFGTAVPAESDRLRNDAPDVITKQVNNPLPTVVLIDYDPARDGRQYMSRGMVLSHPLHPAERLFSNTGIKDAPLEGFATDQLIDGNLWVLDDWDEPSDELVALQDLWQQMSDVGEAL